LLTGEVGDCLGKGVWWNEMGLLKVIYKGVHVCEIEPTTRIVATQLVLTIEHV
jgi:hypothetical protein